MKPAFPKPKDKKHTPLPAVIVYPDGRERCNRASKAGREEFERRRLQASWRDGGRCCLCGLPVHWLASVAAHKTSKGMHGSKIDDRLENLGVAHWQGNLAQGSKPLDKYLELPLETRIRNCGGRV